jgi:uncharacterized low-complexity protein
MKKTQLINALGSAIAVSLLSMPLANASENPFAIQKANGTMQLAEADKNMEGKCSDGKCGANKMKEGACSAATGKAKEGKCGEGKCGANKMKMKEGGCSGTMAPPTDSQ